jgi:cellulose synthase/poly-beta-1,6-N-acetylglucosamine synthase-like glycosyltransferase
MIALSIILSVIGPILIFVYARQLYIYTRAFVNIDIYHTDENYIPTVSVIIPARNEEKNIGRCLDALLKLNYPANKLQIVVVDDDSSDRTAGIVSGYPVTLIKNKPTPGTIAFKKNAITAGIQAATGEIIVTTDADCIVQSNWLNILTTVMHAHQAYMVTGPVRMIPGSGFLSKFQSLDFAILQGITAASVHSGLHDMSSGANLAYHKKAFEAVNGFSGIDDIASGDDMLLMQKISGEFPGKVCYAFSKQAIVDTAPEPTWGSFLRQRIRWASKATRYRDKKIFRILLLVYLLNLVLFLTMCLAWMGSWQLFICLTLIFLKTLVEWNFVSRVLDFFSLQDLMPMFPIAQPIHIIYTVISGFFGQAGSYRWKGRKVK